MKTLPLVLAAVGALWLAAAPVATQTPTPPAPQAPPAQAGAGDKLAEWPPLKDADKDRLLALVGQFRKDDPKIQEEAQRQLVALGEAAMPLLMQRVTDAAENQNARIFAVLDQVLTKRHAALMARETKKPRVELRRYLAQRLCRFGDPELAPVLETLQKDKDALTAFYAQLGLLAQRRVAALSPVLTYTKTNWATVGPLVAETLTPARSPELGVAVFEAIAKAAPVDQMAGLRLLRYLMVKEQGMLLRTYLEAPDNTVLREAVNTARVLHGEAPIENLSVFQAIEHAKQWRQKI